LNLYIIEIFRTFNLFDARFRSASKKGKEYKKNSQLVFASWPLRRRTDEEIIRLCAYEVVQDPCQNQIKDIKN